MAVSHVAGEPPNIGSRMRPAIGCTAKSRAADVNSVRENAKQAAIGDLVTCDGMFHTYPATNKVVQT